MVPLSLKIHIFSIKKLHSFCASNAVSYRGGIV